MTSTPSALTTPPPTGTAATLANAPFGSASTFAGGVDVDDVAAQAPSSANTPQPAPTNSARRPIS
jgi:hypothetical protein